MIRLRSKLLQTGAILIVPILMLSVHARAGLVAVAFTPVSANDGNIGFGYSLGYQFTMNSTVSVTALGYYSNNALTESHDVGIYTLGNPSGTLLTSTTVTNADPLTANFRYHTTAAVTLTAGQTYVIAGVTGKTDFYTHDPTAFSTDPALTIGTNQFSISNTLIYPIVSTPAVTTGYFGPNFQFDPVNGPSPVPEPASFAMAGTAVVIGLVHGWRRRRAN